MAACQLFIRKTRLGTQTANDGVRDQCGCSRIDHRNYAIEGPGVAAASSLNRFRENKIENKRRRGLPNLESD